MHNNTILIADDERVFLKLYENLFKTKKIQESSEEVFDVKTFPSGEKLLDFFKKEYENSKKVPLCILDMMMPGMDGLETGNELRKIDPEVIIIIITANARLDIDKVRESLKQNIYYMKKPFNFEELFCLVDSLLKSWNKNLQIKEHQITLIDAERQRVMMESLGAACHHLGQPLSAALCNLEILSIQPNLEEKQKKTIEKCLKFMGQMKDILFRLQQIREYRRTPYTSGLSILDINQD